MTKEKGKKSLNSGESELKICVTKKMQTGFMGFLGLQGIIQLNSSELNSLILAAGLYRLTSQP